MLKFRNFHYLKIVFWTPIIFQFYNYLVFFTGRMSSQIVQSNSISEPLSDCRRLKSSTNPSIIVRGWICIAGVFPNSHRSQKFQNIFLGFINISAIFWKLRKSFTYFFFIANSLKIVQRCETIFFSKKFGHIKFGLQFGSFGLQCIKVKSKKFF